MGDIYFIIFFFEIIDLIIIDNSVTMEIYNSVSCEGSNDISRFFYGDLSENHS